MIMNPKSLPKPWSIRTSGFTLIEVLITVLITSIGLLALAAMQVRALQDSHSSFQRTLVIVQANDLVERLWAGRCAPGFPGIIYTDWRKEHRDLSTLGAAPLIREWNAPTTIGGLAPNFNVTIDWNDPRARDRTNPSLTFSFRVPTDAC
jgi:type IV pilus assembly protein PilV